MDGAASNLGWALGRGVVLGVAATLLGWAKSKNRAPLTWKGFVLKLPVGIVVGICASVMGIEFNDALTWASGLGLVEVADKLTKMLVRRFRPTWLSFDLGGGYVLSATEADVLVKLVQGTISTREEVIEATEMVRTITAAALNGQDRDDAVFKQHVDFVANMVIQNVRKEGWTQESCRNIGKLLFRLFQVWRKYARDKHSVTSEELLTEVKVIAEALQQVISGE